MSRSNAEEIRRIRWVKSYREKYPEAERWARGYGPIQHTVETQARVFAMAERLKLEGEAGDGLLLFDLLYSLDRVTSAAMWVVVHETYARRVYLDGRALAAEDFKPNPEGHTGGALNMVPAYAGYMAVNCATGLTRSWIMGQGHSVAAVDTVNLLLDNMTPRHAERYSVTDEGLTRYVNDFYSYRITPDGRQDSPLGSHVNPHTAGGLAEGGYLGFTELLYIHMPLPGERLVVFLSDGAFEEQRGSDWAPRWWRARDSGYAMPIMIKNGRRIDQRTTVSQQGGADWFLEHLRLNHFDPFVFDGRDPAAFVWAIHEMETRLDVLSEAAGGRDYPVRLPYGVALAPKGAGFYGEGTNLAHNLPLMANPHLDPVAVRNFNESAAKLWVAPDELKAAIGAFQHHPASGRVKERDHALVNRRVRLKTVPEPALRPVPANRRDPSSWTRSSPMAAVDAAFMAVVQQNPELRPRVGNPDEMRSNRLIETLDRLKFRVTDPEEGIPEDLHGTVVTALNEEAVASAALGNKGGINLIHTYEAFGTKMQGVMRQEIIWSAHCKELGLGQEWLSVPLFLTSHTWENAKNELSHQDPAMAESMMGEFSDVSRVVFPPDHNTAALATLEVYQTHGQLWTLVVTKQDSAPDLFAPEEARVLLAQGAQRLDWAGHRPSEQQLVLTAVGSYQLEEVLKASNRLAERDVPHSVVYMFEPGRFREPRGEGERAHQASAALREELYPASVASRIFVVHTRPEPFLGVVQPLHTGFGRTRALGFIGHGGTLTAPGMMFVNRCTWAHILSEAAGLLGLPDTMFLNDSELEVLRGRGSPEGVVI